MQYISYVCYYSRVTKRPVLAVFYKVMKMSWFSLFFIEFHRVNWPAGAPEVNQILWEGQKHRMLLRITEDFTVCLCTFFSQCKCWEGFLTYADPVDKGEEPAFCWVIERDYICAIQLQRHFLRRFSCLFVKQQKLLGKIRARIHKDSKKPLRELLI